MRNNQLINFVLITLISIFLGIQVSGFTTKAQSIPDDISSSDLLMYTQGHKTNYTPFYFRTHRYSTNLSRRYINRVVQSEYHYINVARHYQEKGVNPLHFNYQLSHLAKLRARQASHRFSHYSSNGQLMNCLDATRFHWGTYRQNQHNLGENMCKTAKLVRFKADHRTAGYYFKAPQALASTNVYDLVNNDAASHWTHGINIMTNRNRYIGIGTYYNRHNHSLYILSEFSNYKPRLR